MMIRLFVWQNEIIFSFVSLFSFYISLYVWICMRAELRQFHLDLAAIMEDLWNLTAAMLT